jgi:hypothetical protein
MDPIKLLRDAITAVPAVKYALGIAGIAAVVAIVLGLKLNPQVAVFGTLIVLGLMFVLVVFSRYAGHNSTGFLGPATLLVWFYTLAVIATTVLFMTSYFLHQPLDFRPEAKAVFPTGSVTLYDGFRFSGQSIFNFAAEQIEGWGAADADIGVANPRPDAAPAEFFLLNDYPPYTDPNAKEHGVENAGIIDMHVQDLDQVTIAPASGYSAHYFKPIVKHIYCVRTRDGHHFAKIKVTGIEKDRISFDYVYQPDGTRNFSH